MSSGKYSLIQRICIAFNGVLKPRHVQTSTSDRLAALVLSWNVRKFWMLLKMPFPSSMACRIVEKSSSVRIISAASLATSVPLMPIDMPMSALFNAGASLTPSPVIATISPLDCSARMIFSL